MKVSKKDRQGDSGVYAVASKFNDELGWIFRKQSEDDIGIDAIVEVVEDGISHGQLLAMQIKSGNSYFREESASGIVYRFNNEHYEYWIQYDLPVLIILHKPSVNEAYWQIVNKDTAQGTGINWKIVLPKSNIISNKDLTKIKAYCDYVVAANRYSVMAFNDGSHGAAKRYSARILLNGDFSRGEIIQVIRKITNDLKDRQYHRNKLTQMTWGGKRANVIWLFIFPSFEDVANNNWICRSQWIDPELDQQFRPSAFSGIEIGGDLTIDWSENYNGIAEVSKDKEITKESYLKLVNEILTRLIMYIKKAISLTKQYDIGYLSSTDYIFRMKEMQPAMRELYFKNMYGGIPPLECKDFDNVFDSLVSFADNVFNPFSKQGLDSWNDQERDLLVKEALQDFENTLRELEYEKNKLH